MPVAGPASERTRIQLCGRLSVQIDGVELAASLRGKQVPLLLAYMLLHRTRNIGREELIGALWPDRAPVSQDAALRTLLSRLRSALGSGALTGRDELILTLPEPVWIDLEAAASATDRAQRALEHGDARAAWALAQVPLNIAARGLLPGSQADWLEPARRELEDVRRQALETVGQAGLRLGGSQLGSAARAARTLIELEPYRESGYVLLMEALAAEGNVAEGLRVFERLRVLLRDELGTSPSPDTIGAHKRLLAPTSRTTQHGGGRRSGHEGRARIELPPELLSHSEAPLIGREVELAELGRLWSIAGASNGDETVAAQDSSAARGRVVLLTGDPGIGKTRLVAEIARRAHEAGAFVLAGRSPQEALVPYQPFVEALRHYFISVPSSELRTSFREYGAELVRLVPELRRRAPELSATPEGEPGTERYRLFEAVVGLLNEISAAAPVLLVLDDLHWADRPTLLLLRHIARAPHPGRVLVLGAYRSTEQPLPVFGEMLAELRRERLVTRLRIEGLDEAETAELVYARAGRRPSLAFTRALHNETEGNPLFVEEIVRHLAEAGVLADRARGRELRSFGLPEGVKEVIARRLARLDDQAMEVLRVAAVIGRDFELSLLERVTSLEEEGFLRSLDEVLAARLVLESPTGPSRYSFSHALIRETLYEGLSAPRRARMHRRVGQALEEAGVERHLTALALHFTRAAGSQDAEKAILYAIRAAEQATEALAHEDAAEYYLSALEVLERSALGELPRQAELLNLLGEAQVRAGERARAWESFRRASTVAAELKDANHLARAAIGASRRYIQEPGVVNEELIAMLERALEMTEGECTLIRVRLLARMCGALYYSPQRARITVLSAEADEVARRLGAPEALAYAAAARRRALWEPGHLDDRLQASTELLRCAREAGNLELELQAHAWLALDLLERGDRAALDAQVTAFTDGAQRLRQPLYLWQSGVWRSMRSLLDGRLEESERLAHEALASSVGSEEVTAPAYHIIQLASIIRELDRHEELERLAARFLQAAPPVPLWRAVFARVLFDIGRQGDAAAELGRLAEDDFAGIARDGNWMCTMTLVGELTAQLHDRERARTIYRQLLPSRELIAMIGIGAVCQGSLERYLGLLAAAGGEAEKASEHFERALEAHRRLQAPVWLAHTQLDYASLIGPRSDQGAELLAAAADTAYRLSLPAVARRARESGAS